MRLDQQSNVHIQDGRRYTLSRFGLKEFANCIRQILGDTIV